jgi:hypothetical protein
VMIDPGKRPRRSGFGLGAKNRLYRLNATEPIKHLWSKPAERGKTGICEHQRAMTGRGRLQTGSYRL